jgi:erythronate-4-phosphate dehydrogenase
MAGRDINANSVKNADVLIVRSRTRVDEKLLAGSCIKF